jgi:hypothetical protein
VLFAGELAGDSFEIVVSPPVPLGPADTLAGLLALVDEMMMRFAALDLSELYDEEALPVVREAIDNYLAALREFGAIGELLPPAQAAEIDALFDASGVPELVRAAIAELSSLAARATDGHAAGDLTNVVPRVGRAIEAVRGATQAIGVPLYKRLGVRALLRSAARFHVAGLIVTGVAYYAGNPLTPVIVDLDFLDSSGEHLVDLPVAGGFAQVVLRGRSILGTEKLIVRTAGGAWERVGEQLGSGTLRYRLPDALGFCGQAYLAVDRAGLVSEQRIGTSIQPSLRSVLPSEAELGDMLELFVGGVNPCPNRVLWRALEDSLAVRDFVSSAEAVAGDHNQLRTGAGIFSNNALREPPPVTYELRVEVEGEVSEEAEVLRFDSKVTGLAVTCDEQPLVASDTLVCSTECTVDAEPLGRDLQLPLHTSVEWSEESEIVEIAATEEITARFRARRTGTAAITARATTGDIVVAEGELHLIVEDPTPPLLSRFNFAPPCRATTLRPGGMLSFIPRWSDCLGVVRSGFAAFIGPDRIAQESRDCPDLPVCDSHTFTLTIPEDASSGDLTIVFEAFDEAGNRGEFTLDCPYDVVAPTQPPTPEATSTPTHTPRPGLPCAEPTPRPGVGQFLEIAGPDTVIPNAEGGFRNISFFGISDGNVYINDDTRGIYGERGCGLELVLGQTTGVPGSGGQNFNPGFIHFPSIDGDTIAFTGNFLPVVFTARIGGNPITGVRALFELPNSPPEFFDDVFAFLYRDRVVAMGGGRFDVPINFIHPLGVYIAEALGGGDYIIQAVAELGSPIPNTATVFDDIYAVGLDIGAQRTFAFAGCGDCFATQRFGGVYRVVDGAGPFVVADTQTPVPRFPNSMFRSFHASGTCIAVDGSDVAFRTTPGSTTGIYAAGPQPLRVIADRDTAIAGREGNVVYDCPLAYDSGVVAFRAAWATGNGIYANAGGSLIRVIGQGDLLGGKQLSSVRLGSVSATGDDALDDGELVFEATFTDFTRAIYLTRVVP